jgi:hypothetical protein
MPHLTGNCRGGAIDVGWLYAHRIRLMRAIARMHTFHIFTSSPTEL